MRCSLILSSRADPPPVLFSSSSPLNQAIFCTGCIPMPPHSGQTATTAPGLPPQLQIGREQRLSQHSQHRSPWASSGAIRLAARPPASHCDWGVGGWVMHQLTWAWSWRSGGPQDCTDRQWKRDPQALPGEEGGCCGGRRLRCNQLTFLIAPMAPTSVGEELPKAFSCQGNGGGHVRQGDGQT